MRFLSPFIHSIHSFIHSQNTTYIEHLHVPLASSAGDRVVQEINMTSVHRSLHSNTNSESIYLLKT